MELAIKIQSTTLKNYGTLKKRGGFPSPSSSLCLSVETEFRSEEGPSLLLERLQLSQVSPQHQRSRADVDVLGLFLLTTGKVAISTEFSFVGSHHPAPPHDIHEHVIPGWFKLPTTPSTANGFYAASARCIFHFMSFAGTLYRMSQ